MPVRPMYEIIYFSLMLQLNYLAAKLGIKWNKYFEDIWNCRLKKKVYIDIKPNFIKIRYLYSSSWDKCRRISISFAINSGGYFYSKLKKVPFLFKKCTHSGGWHHQSSVLPLLARQQNKVPLSILQRVEARAIWGENCRGCEGPGWL